MDSPQHHHAPHAMCSPGHVAPINLGLPLHAPDPALGNNPFVAPAPAPAPVNNPFLALPAPAPVPGNIPFLAPAPAPAVYNGQQYNHLPAALAQQLAAIPPLPVYIGRGRGRGRGCGHQAHPPPDVVPPPIIPPAQHGGHGQGRGQGHAPAPAAIVC
jgi:hypothetical protein